MNPSMRILHAQRPDWPVFLHQVTQTLQYIEEAADPVIEEFADLVVTAQPGSRLLDIFSEEVREYGRTNLRQVPPGFMTSRHDGQRIGQQKGAWNTWDANENVSWRKCYDWVAKWRVDHAHVRARALEERDYRLCGREEWMPRRVFASHTAPPAGLPHPVWVRASQNWEAIRLTRLSCWTAARMMMRLLPPRPRPPPLQTLANSG